MGAVVTPHEAWVVERMMRRGWEEGEIRDALSLPRPGKPDVSLGASIEHLWAQGLRASAIAKRLGITVDYVYKYAHTHRDTCPSRHHRSIESIDTAPDIALMERMRREGATYKVIAQVVGRGERYVRDHLHEIGC
jgi:DNA-binding CsgD family transcriptional regulator